MGLIRGMRDSYDRPPEPHYAAQASRNWLMDYPCRTHLDADTILGLVIALKSYQGALLVVTHDRFFCRCVVEGQSPAKLRKRPGIDEDDDLDEESSSDSDDDRPQKKGAVYRMFKGQLRLLDGGMDQYEEICERTAARLAKAQK